MAFDSSRQVTIGNLTARIPRDVDRVSEPPRSHSTTAMKLDDKILRLAESIDSEIQRTLEKHRARIAPYDDVSLDDRNGRLTYRKGDEVIYNAAIEEVATLGADSVFSWGWAQRPGYVKRTRKVEVAKSLFDELGLVQLKDDEIRLDDRTVAERLVRIVLNASRADGVFRIERGTRTIYYALFESGGLTAVANRVPSGKLVRRMTPSFGMRVSTAPSFMPSSNSIPAARPVVVPREDGSAPRIESVLQQRRTASGTMAAALSESTPPTSQRVIRSEAPKLSAKPSPLPSPPPPSGRPSRPTIETAAPRTLIESPPTSRPSPAVAPPREPSRANFMPVAQAVFADISSILTGRITQAVLILNVRRTEPKTFSLEVVAMDAEMKFRAVEASRELRKIVSDLISVDETSGNGTWRRLVAYISMQNGATLTFEVK